MGAPSARGLFHATGKTSRPVAVRAGADLAGVFERAEHLDREEHDFYPTPPEPTRALLSAEGARLPPSRPRRSLPAAASPNRSIRHPVLAGPWPDLRRESKGRGMTAYYNEFDPYAAEWLRNLIAAGHIAPGDVDERSIADVRPDDLHGYTQCHFFAGIGGWSLAARLAGWPDDRPLWTGSCPCQPFSQQGKQRGFADPRHLWPEFRRLICDVRPPVVFGEQVTASPDWLNAVRSDLGEVEYSVGATPIEAASAGAFSLRDRFWFVADTARPGRRGREEVAARDRQEPGRPSAPLCLIPRPIGGRGRSPLRVSDVLCASYGVSERVAQLRAYGNAIVPQVAAEVIGAFMDITKEAA